MQQTRQEKPPAMTFDEVSMERSQGFVNALQELKNLRPQLYSAAEYCEKSYLHSEQNHMVMDNLKDYAVQTLVNAVDHLGTVAYKLSDLLEQQTVDVSTMELRVVNLNQQLLTCQIYTDKEGLRQQRLLAIIPSHHKHYVLPNSVNKKVHFGPFIKTHPRQNYNQARPRLHSSDHGSKTLSWHLDSTGSPFKVSSHDPRSTENVTALKTAKTSEVFHLQEDSTCTKPPDPLKMQNGGAVTRTRKNPLGSSRALMPFKSSEVLRTGHKPVSRSRSTLSSFFYKQKTSKMKTGPVS